MKLFTSIYMCVISFKKSYVFKCDNVFQNYNNRLQCIQELGRESGQYLYGDDGTHQLATPLNNLHLDGVAPLATHSGGSVSGGGLIRQRSDSMGSQGSVSSAGSTVTTNKSATPTTPNSAGLHYSTSAPQLVGNHHQYPLDLEI